MASSNSSIFDAGCWGGREKAAGPSTSLTASCLEVCASFPPTPLRSCSQPGWIPDLPGEISKTLMSRPHSRESRFKCTAGLRTAAQGKMLTPRKSNSSFIIPGKQLSTLALKGGDGGESTPLIFCSGMWTSPSHLGNCLKRQVLSPGSGPGARGGPGGRGFI